MAKEYNLYCAVCGSPVRAAKRHTTTCSALCRVKLSDIVRYETGAPGAIVEPPVAPSEAKPDNKTEPTKKQSEENERLEDKS